MLKIINIESQNYSREANKLLRTFAQVDEYALSRAELLAEISAYDILITRLGHHINSEVINKGKKLKAIVTATTGLDHIDVEYAQEKGVAVLSLKGEYEYLQSIPATGEHTFALILALLRNIPAATNSVLNGEWDRDKFIGRDLENRRLGLIGVGRIGQKVAQIAQGFDMEIGGYDPSPKQILENVQYCSSMNELLSWAEIVSVHVPLNRETTLLIGKPGFTQMPRGGYFVNTSRGMVVNEEDLIDVLAQGHLAGAALDVVHSEQDIQNGVRSAIIEYAKEHSNLILTPHIGGATSDSMHKTEIFMAKKLKKFLEQFEANKS